MGSMIGKESWQLWTTHSVGVTLVPVALVEKLLIFALELVVEHHTLDPNVVFLKPFGSSHVRGVKLRVVRQFTGPRVP